MKVARAEYRIKDLIEPIEEQLWVKNTYGRRDANMAFTWSYGSTMVNDTKARKNGSLLKICFEI